MSASNSSKTKASGFEIALVNHHTKGDFKNTLAESATALVLGGLLGSFTGYVVGRPSLLSGFLVTTASYYFGIQPLTTFGIGMMSSGYVAVANKQVNGTPLSGMEEVKERARIFREGLKVRLYFDKFMKKESSDESTNGLGEVRYFVYPSQAGGASKNSSDMNALDRLEKQVRESAKQYIRTQAHPQADAQPMSGSDMNSLPEERII